MIDQFSNRAKTAERLGNFKSGCEKAGREFDPMRLALNRTVIVTESAAETEAAMAQRVEAQKKIDQFGKLPGNEPTSYDNSDYAEDDAYIIGRPDEVIGRLRVLEDMGFAYILITTVGGKEKLRLFSAEVMPAFRS